MSISMSTENIQLPPEIVLTIMSYLDYKDLVSTAKTCKDWKIVADTEKLWKSLNWDYFNLKSDNPKATFIEYYKSSKAQTRKVKKILGSKESFNSLESLSSCLSSNPYATYFSLNTEKGLIDQSLLQSIPKRIKTLLFQALSQSQFDYLERGSIKNLIISRSKYLKHLVLEGCKHLTSGDLIEIFSRTTQLKSLTLGSPNVTDAVILQIHQNLTKLKKFNLWGQSKLLTDNGLATITDLARRLNVLNLRLFKNGFSDAKILNFLSSVDNIKKLTLDFDRAIPREGFKRYIDSNPAATQLYLYNFEGVAEASLEQLPPMRSLTYITDGVSSRLIPKVPATLPPPISKKEKSTGLKKKISKFISKFTKAS